jgi:hypothetical protein
MNVYRQKKANCSRGYTQRKRIVMGIYAIKEINYLITNDTSYTEERKENL